MRNNKIIILFSIMIAIMISFIGRFTFLMGEFESTAKEKCAAVNEYIEMSSSFIDLMTVYGNSFSDQVGSENRKLYRLLKYNPDTNSYNMDAAGAIRFGGTIGNLTGLGKVPVSGEGKEELNLAFQYNEFFNSFSKRLPDIAWMYYISESNFALMYPWISSESFAFSKRLKTFVFYNDVSPQNNPLRRPRWTNVYLDHAGKGLMVTLSSPIYGKNGFRGVVSLDLTNVKLSGIMHSGYDGYLIDDSDAIVASSFNIKFEDKVVKLGTWLNISEADMKAMKLLEKNRVQRLGSYYIYSAGFESAPWRMLFRVPVSMVVGQSVLYTLPILVICVLLFLAAYEVEERKKTGEQLNRSLEELKAYHQRLENAAKQDFLTATYNRRGFMDRCCEVLSQSSGIKRPVSILLGDIDYFKDFNDTFGHAAGDRVLIEIAGLIRQNIGENDIVCRWGGEEFLIMLPGSTYDGAMAVAEVIRRAIENNAIEWKDSHLLRVTMTFGVVEHDYADEIEKSISKADNALYKGKANGRNRVVGYR